MLPTKESIEIKIKNWFQVSVVLWLAYMLGDIPYVWCFNAHLPNAIEVAFTGGCVVHILFFWYIVPRFIYRKATAFIRKPIAFVAVQSAPDFQLGKPGLIWKD